MACSLRCSVRLQNAAEFRGVKREREEALGVRPDPAEEVRKGKRSRGTAFGTGVLDEDDAYGIMDNYVTAEENVREKHHFEIAMEDDEDEDVPGRQLPLFLKGHDSLFSFSHFSYFFFLFLGGGKRNAARRNC